MPVSWNRLLFSDVSDSASVNGTNVLVRDEVRIETVIVILWVAGGVLLLTLLILLVCILKNNKKSGGQCSSGSNVFRIDQRRRLPRDGRLNQGYSNYDEIWTWIPIVRGQENECTHSSQNVYTTSTSNNTEPPPYNVAVASPTHSATQHPVTASQFDQHSVSVTQSTQHPVTGHPVSTAISSVSGSTNAQVPNNVRVRTSNELIVDQIISSALLSSNTPSVTRTSTARENQSTPRVQRQDLCTDARRQSKEIIQRHHLRDSALTQYGNNISSTNHVNDLNKQTDTSQGHRNVAKRQNARARLVHSPYLSRVPENNRGESARSQSPQRSEDFRDVRYDDSEGLYSFVTSETGRRAWCDIPPGLLDEDGPPPYTPAPDYPGRQYRSRAHVSTSSNRNRLSMESHTRQHSDDQSRDVEIPPDYPLSPQERRRNHSEHAPRYDEHLSAPIARLDYDYF